MSKVLIAALSGMIALFVHDNAGDIEGRLFPVMGPLSLSAPEAAPPPDHRTRWHVRTVKQRDCDFVRVDWYLGPRTGRRVRVQAVFVDPPRLHPTGQEQGRAILISLDAAEVLGNSHADVIHRCRWRPWYTRSRLYN